MAKEDWSDLGTLAQQNDDWSDLGTLSQPKEQDGALKQGYVGAKSSLATTKALGIGDFDEAARLAAERAAYAKANPGSKEGNELYQA